MQKQISLRQSIPSILAQAEPHWYAAYTRPNHEKRVAEQLDSRNLEQLLPLYSSVRQSKGGKVRLASPLFPGYVFVRVALQERSRVPEVPGVVNLVGHSNHPVRVSEEDISTVRLCLNSQYRAELHARLNTNC